MIKAFVDKKQGLETLTVSSITKTHHKPDLDNIVTCLGVEPKICSCKGLTHTPKLSWQTAYINQVLCAALHRDFERM